MKQKQYATDVAWDLVEPRKYTAAWKQFRHCKAWTFYDGDCIWIKAIIQSLR